VGGKNTGAGKNTSEKGREQKRAAKNAKPREKAEKETLTDGDAKRASLYGQNG